MKVRHHPAQTHGIAAVHHRRYRSEPLPRGRHGGAGAVDQLLDVAGDEELRGRVQLAPPGDGHLQRRRRQPAGHPRLAARRGPDEQPRVVPPDRGRPDQDGVTFRPYGINAVKVGVIGQ
jgi:hypothetical protein